MIRWVSLLSFLFLISFNNTSNAQGMFTALLYHRFPTIGKLFVFELNKMLKDPQARNVTFRRPEGMPRWLHFDLKSKTLRGVPSDTDIDDISFFVYATDGKDLAQGEIRLETKAIGWSGPFWDVPQILEYACVGKFFQSTEWSRLASDSFGDFVRLQFIDPPKWLKRFGDGMTVGVGVYGVGTPQKEDIGAQEFFLRATSGKEYSDTRVLISVSACDKLK